MFEVICKEKECANKNKIYYFMEVMERITCGACQKELTAAEMSKEEFDEVFDYDPYKEPTIGFLPL